jgi:hypothetical protein
MTWDLTLFTTRFVMLRVKPLQYISISYKYLKIFT